MTANQRIDFDFIPKMNAAMHIPQNPTATQYPSFLPRSSQLAKSSLNPSIAVMDTEAANTEHATDLTAGPFSVLYQAVRTHTPVLINVRNNHKLLGRVKAYDRHMNLYVFRVGSLLLPLRRNWILYRKDGSNTALYRGIACPVCAMKPSMPSPLFASFAVT
jgi:small nuclear ribonucleoprotein (snRNP)-like protein